MSRTWFTHRIWQSPLITLTWDSILYGEEEIEKIPDDKRGIYAFIVCHNSNALPPHGYILYIGIAGSNYIYKYFVDMWYHFNSLRGVLSKPSVLHYIIGNSTFYGTLVPAKKIYADMLSELGFYNVQIKPIRKRNSKKELFEFDISATY